MAFFASLSALALLALLAIRLRRLLHATPAARGRPLRLVFLHPDLGIGGAERLVVDAALELQRRGHSVLIQTAHHDPSRCFAETADGRLAVRVAGAVVPRHVRGRLHVACASVRALAGAAWLVLVEPYCDVVLVDQVAAAVPLLRLAGLPVLFYCHFPDKLLASGEAAHAAGDAPRAARGRLRRAYRLPFDLLEEVCTAMASAVLVNSAFTASVFDASFSLLRATRGRLLRWPRPRVLHPAIDVKAAAALPWPEARGGLLLVSINRFERKKDLGLAIDAFRAFHATAAGRGARLVLAGGWDARLREQVEYFAELREKVERLGLEGAVELRRNVSDDERRQLLRQCEALVYTPSFEHFGIVPLEGMAAGRPVIAVARGGPCESVVHGEGGWLCEPTEAAFAAAFAEAARLSRAGELRARGAAARAHVEANFSLEEFGAKLEEFVLECCSPRKA
ncbi:hypothetical protein AB1Y20_001727 [Prymnesium parvum]|uniref:Alpha-1,3/1,6-mannosyltransferase ALG2 n=1 Tax=Prymnesium parvum TaxID=97485 RepID=A0AB34KCW4_PRYPA